MRKIFDCSNSQERPLNRYVGGPVENEFVTLLKKYSRDSIQFQENVSELNLEEVIFKYNCFKNDYENIMKHISEHNFDTDLEKSLAGYFKVFSEY